MANYHVEQRDAGFLAGNPICLARHKLAAMLALVRHGRRLSKANATRHLAVEMPKNFTGSIFVSPYEASRHASFRVTSGGIIPQED